MSFWPTFRFCCLDNLEINFAKKNRKRSFFLFTKVDSLLKGEFPEFNFTNLSSVKRKSTEKHLLHFSFTKIITHNSSCKTHGTWIVTHFWVVETFIWVSQTCMGFRIIIFILFCGSLTLPICLLLTDKWHASFLYPA